MLKLPLVDLDSIDIQTNAHLEYLENSITDFSLRLRYVNKMVVD